MTKISITRHSQHNELFLSADDGRVWPVASSEFPASVCYDHDFARTRLDVLREYLEAKGEAVEVDDAIPAPHA